MSEKTYILKVDRKGRINIPKELMRQQCGYTIEVEVEKGVIILRPVPVQ